MVGEDSGRPAAASAAALQIPSANPAETTTQGNQTVNSVFGITNWKTSIAGAVAGLAAVAKFVPALQPYSDMLTSIMGIAVGAGLIAAKDADVTGGSVPQTVEAQQRAKSSPVK
jgi:hypothetical protein